MHTSIMQPMFLEYDQHLQEAIKAMAANLYENLLLGECIIKWLKNGKNYNPYESKQDFLNDLNGQDCCFKKCYYSNI